MNPLKACCVALLCLLPLGSAGCASWKRADAAMGLALVPNADTVKVDGRPLIRLRGKRSAVWIDAHGGRVVDYHLQDRPTWFWEPDPQKTDGQRQHFVEGARGPNLLQPPGWRTTLTPPRAALDESDYWQVDGAPGELTLLSDEVDGLRWRKTFHITDAGDLWITVELQNLRHSGEATGMASELSAAGPVAPPAATSAPAGAARAPAREQAWFEGHWLLREVARGPEGATGFTFPLGKGASRTRWTEHWWISKAATATQPAGPPPAPKVPGAKRQGAAELPSE